jgi:hypothetical protein
MLTKYQIEKSRRSATNPNMVGPSEKGVSNRTGKAITPRAGTRHSTRVRRPVNTYVPGTWGPEPPPSKMICLQLPYRFKGINVANPAALANRSLHSSPSVFTQRSPVSDSSVAASAQSNASRTPVDSEPKVNATSANVESNANVASVDDNANTNLAISTNDNSAHDINGPLTKFHLFPALPPELRNAIWKYHLPRERIVRIYFFPHDNPGYRKHRYSFGSTDPVPLLSNACHESRTLFLWRYKRDAFKHPKNANGCFFNFQQDILEINGGSKYNQRSTWLSHRTVEADINCVKTLAFPHTSFMLETDDYGLRRALPLPTFMHFRQLEKVIMVIILDHQRSCAHCGSAELSLRHHEMIDDTKQRVSDLKGMLKGGKVFNFMFGDQWEPPKWEYMPICMEQLGRWQKLYVKRLEEDSRPVITQETTDSETVGGSDSSMSMAMALSDTSSSRSGGG